MNKFITNLKLLRRQRKMSQTELAEATGLQPSAISHFERGRRSPSMNNLVRLAEALGVTASDLVGKKSYSDNSLLNAFARMSQRDREIFVEFAEMLAKKNESPLTKALKLSPCDCADGYTIYYPGGRGPCRNCNREAYAAWIEEGQP